MLKKYGILLGCLLMWHTAWADTPSRASLEQLLAIQNFDKMLDDNIQQAQKQNFVDLNSLPKQAKNLSPEKQATLIRIINRYVAESIQAINTPDTRAEIRRLAIDAAQKVYTQKEVDALIQFYSTPEGRSISAKLTQYFTAVSQPIMQVVAQKSQAFQERKQSDLSRELNQVLCGKKHC